VEVVTDDILAMKAVLAELQTLQAVHESQHEPPNAVEDIPEDVRQQHLRSSTASAASVEEFMDDDVLDISMEQLNYQVPTNHLL
jgi:hypothetical protein